MITRHVIRPIIARLPIKRYIADLTDFRKVNDGYMLMLVVIDSFSKFIWTVPFRVKVASSVISAIRPIFMSSGHCFLLHTDNGREFCNDLMSNVFSTFDVRHARSRSRYIWIQGQLERAIQTIK